MSNVDRTISICVIRGRSLNAKHRLTKTRASIGGMSGGADMRIDDPEVSAMHCAVAITGDGIRLYDLDSANEHLSSFRIGSTELVVSITSNHNLDPL